MRRRIGKRVPGVADGGGEAAAGDRTIQVGLAVPLAREDLAGDGADMRDVGSRFASGSYIISAHAC